MLQKLKERILAFEFNHKTQEVCTIIDEYIGDDKDKLKEAREFFEAFFQELLNTIDYDCNTDDEEYMTTLICNIESHLSNDIIL